MKGAGNASWALTNALEANGFTQAEFDMVLRIEKVRNEVVQIDSFTLDEMPVNIQTVTAPPSYWKKKEAVLS